MKKLKSIFLIFSFSVVAITVVNAQQQVMFTQYMFNALAINPAYAGSADALSVTALSRHQWLGLDGAPTTQTLSAHSPINKNNIALGALFLRDKIGVTEQNAFFGSYAYRIKFGGVGDQAKSTLSFGLSLGISNYKAIYSSVGTRSASDPGFNGDDINNFMPNVGAGVYYSTNRFYIGGSSPFLLNNFISDINNADNSAEQIRHFFIMSGYVFDINRSFKLKPNVLMKSVAGAPIEFDVNANLLINDLVWVGVAWRSFASIDFLFELQINSNFRFGYAFDFSTTDLNRVNSGSHEFMLNYVFSFSKSRVVTPRYF